MLTSNKTTRNWQLEIDGIHYTAVQKASRPSFYFCNETGEMKVRNFTFEMIDIHGNVTHEVFEWAKGRRLKEGKLLLVDRDIKEKKQITLEKWMLINLKVVTADFGDLEHNANGETNNATKIIVEVSCGSAYLLPVKLNGFTEVKEVEEKPSTETSDHVSTTEVWEEASASN